MAIGKTLSALVTVTVYGALERMGLPADYLRRREGSRALWPLEPARG